LKYARGLIAWYW